MDNEREEYGLVLLKEMKIDFLWLKVMRIELSRKASHRIYGYLYLTLFATHYVV